MIEKIRAITQDVLLERDLNSRINLDRIVFTKSIKPHIQSGKILECGCGNGILLEMLSSYFEKSYIVGIDLSDYLTDKVREKKLDNVISIRSNIVDEIFPTQSFNTVLFHKSLHEVEAFEGRTGTIRAINNAYRYLKNRGILIIRENLKPLNKEVQIKINSVFAKDRLNKFATDFTPIKVTMIENENNVYTLTLHAALEYITKYDESDWNTEMVEPHFFFESNEWHKILNEIGFQKVIINTDTINQINLEDKKNDFEILFNLPLYRATILAYK